MGAVTIPEAPERTVRAKRGGFITEHPFHCKVAQVSFGFDDCDVIATATGVYDLAIAKYSDHWQAVGGGHTTKGDYLLVSEVKARITKAFNATVTLQIQDGNDGGAFLTSAGINPQGQAGTNKLLSSLVDGTPTGGKLLADGGGNGVQVSVGGTAPTVGRMMVWIYYTEIAQTVDFT